MINYYKMFCCSSLLPSLLSLCFTPVLLLLLPLPELQLSLALIIHKHTPLSLLFLFYVFLMPLTVGFHFSLALRLPQCSLQLPLCWLVLFGFLILHVTLASSALACPPVSRLFDFLHFFMFTNTPRRCKFIRADCHVTIAITIAIVQVS